jgi:solute carrier family 13 (sodium-dependent dicarboxylate transporter), member 2/3/5
LSGRVSTNGAPAPSVTLRRRIGLPLGPFLLLLTVLLPAPAGLPENAWRAAGTGLLMATWWISEAIPIPATALLPLAVFPLLGILPIEAAAAPYANPVIFLFMGGFLLAAGMQRWGLHRRVALRIIHAVGTSPGRLVAGFMLAAAFLSMWVSNTATAVMMLPIGLSVIHLALRDGAPGERDPGESNFAVGLMLGIAYACSIGGMATLIGTPPNALLAGFMAESYGVRIGFGEWMLLGVPLALLGLPIAWWVLTRVAYPTSMTEIPGGRQAISDEIERLGPLTPGEKAVAVVFATTAAAWVVRPLFERWVPGVSDAGIAIAGALALFLIPLNLRRGEFVLDWEGARGIPWDVLVLFGGGLSLAAAITRTGLADAIGGWMGALGFLPLLLLILMVVTVVVFLTELTSNTATAAAFLPVLASMAVGIGENPFFLTVPAALAASAAFMMPVATPPNAIVYGSSFVTVPQMARAGIHLNLLFIALITLVGYLLVLLAFGARPGVIPGWAG